MGDRCDGLEAMADGVRLLAERRPERTLPLPTPTGFKDVGIVSPQLSRHPLDPLVEDIETEVLIGDGRDVQHPLPLPSAMFLEGFPRGVLGHGATRALLRAASASGVPVKTDIGGISTSEADVLKENGGKLVVSWDQSRLGLDLATLGRADGVVIKLEGAFELNWHIRRNGLDDGARELWGIDKGMDVAIPPNHLDMDDTAMLPEHITLLRELTEYRVPIMVEVGPYAIYDGVKCAVESGADAVLVTQQLLAHRRLPLITLYPEALRAYRETDAARSRVRLLFSGDVMDGRDAFCSLAMGADAVGVSMGPLMAAGCGLCAECFPDVCGKGILLKNGGGDEKTNAELAEGRALNYFEGLARDLKRYMALTGFDDVALMDPGPLKALSWDTAAMTGLPLAGYAKSLAMWLH